MAGWLVHLMMSIYLSIRLSECVSAQKLILPEEQFSMLHLGWSVAAVSVFLLLLLLMIKLREVFVRS